MADPVEHSANIRLDFCAQSRVELAAIASVGAQSAVEVTTSDGRLLDVKTTSFSVNNVPLWIQDILPDAWGELVMRHDMKKNGVPASQMTVASRLVYLGRDVLGAIECYPERKKVDDTLENIADLGWLRDQAIRLADHDPDCNLGWMQGSVSLGGARPKFFVDIHDDEIMLNRPAHERDWILKFNGKKDFADGGNIEYAFMKLAGLAGLAVPEIRLVQGKYFAVRRFDHHAGERYWARTFSSLNGHPHTDAHANSYEALVDKLVDLTKRYSQVEQIPRLALFNQITGNNDDHAKNVTFLMDKHYEWRMAPFYDLTFNIGFDARAMAVNETLTPDFSDYVETFMPCGLRERDLSVMVKRIAEVLSSWDDVAKEAGVSRRSSDYIKETMQENITQLGEKIEFGRPRYSEEC